MIEKVRQQWNKHKQLYKNVQEKKDLKQRSKMEIIAISSAKI